MPEIGEIRKATEIGYKGRSRYIWYPCRDCSKPTWKQIHFGNNRPESQRCQSCANRGTHFTAEAKKRMSIERKGRFVGQKHWNWHGGKVNLARGYIGVQLSEDDFFYSMAAGGGYVREHRLVMAKHLGRCLHPWEIVHHKHTKYPAGSIEDKRDNRIENLQLVSDDRHKQITLLENRIKLLEKRVWELELENMIHQMTEDQQREFAHEIETRLEMQ